MKDLLIVTADNSIKAALCGFFEREGWWNAVGCGRFSIDPQNDIKAAQGLNDPGLYRRAGDLLQPLAPEYRHVLVILDGEWEGAPSDPHAIRDAVENHIESAGWAKGDGCGIVIVPELEIWLWADSPHLASLLNFPDFASLRQHVQTNSDAWPVGSAKPADPEEALKVVCRNAPVTPKNPSLFRHVCRAVGTKHCADPAVARLFDALRTWFPPAR